MKFTAKINGLNSWQNAWNSKGTEMLEDIKDSVDEHAHKIERKAKEIVPVDSGRLKGSIVTDIENDGYYAETGTNVEYSDDVEYGTSKQMAQPFLKPAYEEQLPKFIKDIENIVEGIGD